MDKYKAAIVRYEKARIIFSKLNRERSDLVASCSLMDFNNDFDPCSVRAFKELNEYNNSAAYDEKFTYIEAFDCLINEYEGACDSCRKAMSIKYGPLADAKKELGIAKRQISALAKGIIKNG